MRYRPAAAGGVGRRRVLPGDLGGQIGEDGERVAIGPGEVAMDWVDR
jgi:hypothetical protein